MDAFYSKANQLIAAAVESLTSLPNYSKQKVSALKIQACTSLVHAAFIASNFSCQFLPRN